MHQRVLYQACIKHICMHFELDQHISSIKKHASLALIKLKKHALALIKLKKHASLASSTRLHPFSCVHAYTYAVHTPLHAHIRIQGHIHMTHLRDAHAQAHVPSHASTCHVSSHTSIHPHVHMPCQALTLSHTHARAHTHTHTHTHTGRQDTQLGTTLP